jgi:glycosyltransferase involved in cell wall biosynthesis
MIICILCRNLHKDLGGIETFVREFSYALATDGHKVHIIAQDKGDLYRDPIHANITVHDIDLKEKPFYGFWFIDSFFPIEELRFAFAALNQIKKISRSVRIDIVEVMDYFRQGIGLALNGRYPLFLRLHGWMFNKPGYWKADERSLSLKEKCQRFFLQICINKADGIAAVSKSFADYASTVWKIPGHQLSIIHNAVDINKYNPGHGQSRETAIIFSSRLIKNKGVVVLVDALTQVFKESPDLKIYFAACDQLWAQDKIMAKDYISGKLPAKNIQFLGAIPSEDVINYYRKCKISVLPSLYEPFGLAALEAMACGCAIIATKSGGPAEFIKNEQNGLLVEANNPQDLTQAIEKFMTNGALRESCARNALELVKQQYTYQRLVKESLEAYRQAIQRYRQRTAKGNKANA